MAEQEKPISKFQLWTLLMASTKPNVRLSIEYLADHACESSIDTLTEKGIYNELGDLAQRGYVVFHDGGTGDATADHVTITIDGKLHVRRVYKMVSEIVRAGEIPEQLIEKQNEQVKAEIQNKHLSFNTFRVATIDYMPPIISLLMQAGIVFLA